jgi:hypothetical protein
MTSFYDKYLITNSSRNVRKDNNSNVLKNDYTLNYTDYQKLKMAEQYNKLYNEIYKKNVEEVVLNDNKKIYNLSFNILFKNASKVYIDILNELSIYFSDKNKDKNLNKLGLILTKEENMLYIGLLILILSFGLWLIDITK